MSEKKQSVSNLSSGSSESKVKIGLSLTPHGAITLAGTAKRLGLSKSELIERIALGQLTISNQETGETIKIKPEVQTNPSTQEEILQVIESLPSDRLAEVLAFAKSLSTKPSPSSAKSFLAHLKTIGTWSGDDLQDCLH